MSESKPITKEDASRIQSSQDKQGGGKDGFKERTSSAADKAANKEQPKPAGR